MLKKRNVNEPRSLLRKVNNGLSVVVVGLSVYLLALPLLPAVTYNIDKATNSKAPLVRANLPDQTDRNPEVIPAANTLVIPSMNLQKEIFDGKSVNNLEKGVWHRPVTSNPMVPGNMVLVGHRYGNNGDGVFYHLDKVHVADDVIIYWQGKKYKYTVKVVKVVSATDISIESQTKESIVTIYTCTPMWSFKDRLVIVANKVDPI